jgi:hypothetical protein
MEVGGIAPQQFDLSQVARRNPLDTMQGLLKSNRFGSRPDVDLQASSAIEFDPSSAPQGVRTAARDEPVSLGRVGARRCGCGVGSSRTAQVVLDYLRMQTVEQCCRDKITAFMSGVARRVRRMGGCVRWNNVRDGYPRAGEREHGRLSRCDAAGEPGWLCN